jgi:hypothetical protein
MKLRLLIVLAALLLLPSLARAQMPATALEVDARLSAGLIVGGTSTVIAIPSLTVGARIIDRIGLGLGFGLFRVASPGGGVGGTGTNQTTFDFAPTITVDMLKARDNKAAWYAKGALPLGAMITNPRNFFVLGYDVALGARYCPHPNFAASLEGGITGIFVDPNGNGGFGVTTVYGALVGTFYWGR